MDVRTTSGNQNFLASEMNQAQTLEAGPETEKMQNVGGMRHSFNYLTYLPIHHITGTQNA
jgi:hypothetical protein